MTSQPAQVKVNTDIKPSQVVENSKTTVKEAIVVILTYTFILAVLKQELPNYKHMMLFMAAFVPAVSVLRSVHQDLAKNISTGIAIAMGTVFVKNCFKKGAA
jgi:hypothetical protein